MTAPHRRRRAPNPPTPAFGPPPRPTIAAVAAIVLASLALGACGDDDGDAAGAETRVVETGMGPVEIPSDPQRIVSLDYRATLQPLDELEAPLVGTRTRTDGVWDQLSERAQQLPSIGESGGDGGIDLEAIVALEPDLIVGEVDEELYDQLAGIAPTVMIDRDDDWTEHMRVLARIVDRTERADELITEVEERMAALEADIAERWPDGVQVTLMRVRDDIRITQVADRGDSGPWVLREIDAISVTGDLRQVDSDGISPEQLREADGDVILYFAGGGGSDANVEDEFLLDVIDNPLWDDLSAVKAGRAHAVDSDLWFSGSGATAAHLAMDDLVEHVVEAP